MWNKSCAVRLRASAAFLGMLLTGAAVLAQSTIAPASQTTPTAATAATAPTAPAGADAGALTPAEIRAVATRLRADPNLGVKHTVRSLRWIQTDKPPPTESPPWLMGFFEFLGQTGSVLLWIAGGIAAAIAAVWILRLMRARTPASDMPQPASVSHISGLDIRPASLPDDVGAAALALLQAGRTRDALSLLYRGALSRAVHVHGVTVRESFTEGEALRAVESRLDGPRIDYFRELLALWQRATYAGQSAASETVAALCAKFGATLGNSAA